jgi:hypothetical protein
MLLAVVLVSIAGLIPGQSRTTLGIELLVLGIALSLAVVRLTFASPQGPDDPRSQLLSRLAMAASTGSPAP